MGILIPWCANCFDSGVLSHTPGNFLAEKTVKTSLKHDASTGVLPMLTCDGLPLAIWLGGAATLTKENLSLRGDGSKLVNCWGPLQGGTETYLKWPSVLTLRSWSTNQMPILSLLSVSRKALAARLPMRLRVNIP